MSYFPSILHHELHGISGSISDDIWGLSECQGVLKRNNVGRFIPTEHSPGGMTLHTVYVTGSVQTRSLGKKRWRCQSLYVFTRKHERAKH